MSPTRRIVLATATLAAIAASAPPAGAHYDARGESCKDVKFQRWPGVLAADISAKNVACAPARRLVRDVAFSISVPWDCVRKRDLTPSRHMDLLCTRDDQRVTWAGYQ